MFQLLKDPDFDFMGKRHILLALSAVVVLTSIALLATRGLNLGIEFTGGAELQIKFAEEPDLGAIRSVLARIGGTTPVVTTIGDPAGHEVYIKLGSAAVGEQNQDDLTQQVVEVLRDERVRQQRDAGLVDLNVADETIVRRLLAGSPGVSGSDAQALAESILALRKEVAIFHSLDELSAIEGVTPEARRVLQQGAFLGPFAIRSQSYIGPAVGKELMNKALLAIVGSLLGMLIWIWIRFQLRWGFAAVAALTHDTLVTLGLFSLAGKEMSLPVVAAFLTLVGYSVNDTVVVFDRIRENLRTRSAGKLEVVVNRSVNQTLSRTIITTGSTWIVVVGLFIYGGEALSAFSFVLTVGILVGTYSSIYIASPIMLMWQALVERRSLAASARGPSSQRTAKKVRSTSAS